MTNAEDLVRDVGASRRDLRIGMPEREAAREALEAHLAAERIDSTDYERRWAACQDAHNQSQLLRIFADLPAPHPELPGLPCAPTNTDEDVPPLAIAVAIALLLGLPVGIVLGFVYGAWWTLAVPVALTVAMLYAEHLLTQVRIRQPQETAGHDGLTPDARGVR